MKAKNAKKDEIGKAKEKKKIEREEKKRQSLATIKEARQRKREEAAHAKQSKKDWEAQQLEFEDRMRSILWEQGSLEGLVLKPLHVDQPYHAYARKRQMEKMRTTCKQGVASM